MSDFRELIPESREIQLIPANHTSIIPAGTVVRRRQRRKSRRRPSDLEMIAVGSLMVNVIQGILIWILQAGPIG